MQEDEEEEERNTESDTEDESRSDDLQKDQFDYLLSMSMWSLTKERKDELLKNRDEKSKELKSLQTKTPEDLWNDDLDKFLKEVSGITAGSAAFIVKICNI